MQTRADAVLGCFPVLIGGVVLGKVRLPECNMAHTADAVDQNLLCTLSLQLADFLRIGGQIFLGCKVALIFGDSQLAERAVERAGHGVLERGGVGCGQRVALGVSPLVHVEAVDVLAVHIPLFQEIDRPLVHAHRANRQDENQLSALFLGEPDLHGNFVTHVCAELFKVRALDGTEAIVPEALALADGRWIVGDAVINLGNVPALGQNFGKIGTLEGIDHVHNRKPP